MPNDVPNAEEADGSTGMSDEEEAESLLGSSDSAESIAEGSEEEEAGEAPAAVAAGLDVSSMSVAALKEALGARGLARSGNKETLQHLLQDAITTDAAAAGAQEQEPAAAPAAAPAPAAGKGQRGGKGRGGKGRGRGRGNGATGGRGGKGGEATSKYPFVWLNDHTFTPREPWVGEEVLMVACLYVGNDVTSKYI